MREEVFKAALGGLLHDVGKFAQRAGERPGPLWDEGARAEYKCEHALVSTLVQSRLVPRQWAGDLTAPAYHHAPRSRQDRLVSIADRLSSGERMKSSQEEPQRLLSIFTRLSLDGQAPPAEAYLPLRRLRMEDPVLFARRIEPGEDTAHDYARLWQGFLEEAEGLRAECETGEADPEAYLGNLLNLLQEFTWCIPAAAYQAKPDISLYDHGRTTAALAVCLASLDDETVRRLMERPDQDIEVACLVGGDISGVQDFIYTITSRGATSALRGRSLYLQLLTEAVTGYVLERLGLPETNVIYSGGGHFYILAPLGGDEALRDAQTHISKVLLQHHGGDLYLALGQVPMRGTDFFGKGLGARWEQLSQRLRRAKERRFSELGEEMHHLVFEPWRDAGNQERECQVCQREHPDTRSYEDDRADAESGQVRKCPTCVSYERLGDELRRARYLYLEETQPGPGGDQAGDCAEALAAFGMRATLLEEPPPRAWGAPRAKLLALDDGARSRLRPGKDLIVGRRLLVNVTPTDRKHGRERVKPFDELAESSRGIKRLGVLRMDVDNAGRLFSEGFGERASLSRTAALSLSLRLFFEGWVETLAKEFNPDDGAHRIYSIYSGGDDLFIVGSWDAVVELAGKISDEFRCYTGANPAVHLSAGIVLVPQKYPLYQAAEDAGEAENEAKGAPGKDAITFLGQTIKWAQFAQVREWQAKLVAMGEGPDGNKSLLRTLINLQMQHDAVAKRREQEGCDQNALGQPQACYGPWIPQAQYRLVRLKRRGNAEGTNERLEELRRLLALDNFGNIGWIGLAARWAQLLTRDSD